MRILLTLFFLTICFTSCNSPKEQENKKTTEKINSKKTTLFERIPSTESGVDFNNSIKDSIQNKSNLFDFDYFFNGAGLGVEDLNNDGLKDLVFCGNQVPNKIYLNKGNLKFEDVTQNSGINTNKYWSNGITFVDINNDGWMDIYISQGGPYEKSKRKNILLINQKNLTFKEEASKYGLADSGISTQSVFFDYDKDGDLDCVVSNENDYYGVEPNRFFELMKDENTLKQNTTQFYKNTNGKFTNITKKAGLLNPSFGLGVCVSDINNDNWLDIYIANDYYIPDALYINDKKGGFTNEIKTQTNQISFYGMGVDVEDINNDQLQDIFVLDMASSDHIRSKTLMASMNEKKFDLLVNKFKFPYQYMYNSLQLNLGENKFHNIAQMTKLSKTDWSWAGLIADYDNDGLNDIYVTNGYRKYALDNDSRLKVLHAKRKFKGNIPLEVKEHIYRNLPSEKLPNKLFKNKGNLTFKEVANASGLHEPTYSNGAIYSDLDNDGDLDIVINNIDQEAFIYKNSTSENNSGNYLKVVTQGTLSENFAKVKIDYNDQSQQKEVKRTRGYLSSVDNTLHFGLDKNNHIDTLTITWSSGKQEKIYNIKANSTLKLSENNAKSSVANTVETNKYFTKNNSLLSFKHKENTYNDFTKEPLLPYKQSTFGPHISVGDTNNDKLSDIYIGGASGQNGELFIQTKTGFITKKPFPKEDAKYEDIESHFFDADNDNDLDLYVVSGGNDFDENSKNYADRCYTNDGEGNFSKSEYLTSSINTSGQSVISIDYDKDGDLDIIVGNRITPNNYPKHSASIVYENNDGKFTNKTNKVASELYEFGIINKIIKTDFNNDGWDDFIAVGEWTSIGIFLNNKGTFTNIANKSNLSNHTGWWYSIIETDINNDGLKDYLIGNVGENIKFKVSEEVPLKVYADDFDANGTFDIVLSTKYSGIDVPIRGKECSTQQIPTISKKIPTFNEFANANLADIYGEKIYTAYQKEANHFKSILLINKGDETFEKKSLPDFAQTLPILTSEKVDINNDGYEDIIVAGNIYNTEVETPRLDNGYALVLLNDKKNNYKILNPQSTGLYIDGNVKSIKFIKHEGLNKKFLLIGKNNSNLDVFQLNDSNN